jgi:hypothetical protein
MKRFLVLSLLVCAMMGATVLAGQTAVANELPEALQMLGVVQSDVVSAGEAAEIRGTWACGSPSVPSFGQFKKYCIEGTATGDVTLYEGMFGAFAYASEDENFVVEGQFGGLQGSIGVSQEGNVEFMFAGKAFQESFSFTGDYEQCFEQQYGTTW